LRELSIESTRIKTSDTFLSKLDREFFVTFPLMRRFAWFTALICWGKKNEDNN
jgi:hypothetical protein